MEALLNRLYTEPGPQGKSWVAFIHSRLREHYVSNESVHTFLLSHQNRVDLSQFLCLTYGKVGENQREAHFIMFHSWYHYKNRAFYEIQMQLEQTEITSQITLTRQRDFHFQDPGNYQRSTFLIDFQHQQLFRLYELRYYLYLPHPHGLDTSLPKILIPLIPEIKKKQIYDRLCEQLISLLPSLQHPESELLDLQIHLRNLDLYGAGMHR